MKKYLEYNVKKYIKSIKEVKKMVLEAVLNSYRYCKEYTLSSDVSDYIHYIEQAPFYIQPSISDIRTSVKSPSLNPKFVLFSAPGATGKSSLAKYIANRFNAIYWNLAKVKIGTNSFAGSVLATVGASKYSEFVGDLNSGDMLLVIDALDEAEIVSGRKMISSFICDINDTLSNHKQASVFLLARTETAQYIASFCAENNISISHYEIGFFAEESAKEFIVKSVSGSNTPTIPDIDCAKSYYDAVKRNITQEESASFLGYAPVLQAIAAHIKDCPNRQRLISELSNQRDCVSIITKIMDDLLIREQTEKVVPAFIERCKESHPEFTDWDKVYSSEEQLVRLIYYILLEDTSYENYVLDFLPPQLVDDYTVLLNSFLPQHPYVRSNYETAMLRRPCDFTGPAFRDYSLAKIILNNNYEALADLYFKESQSQSFFPSQIFFDCYTRLSERAILPNHVSYVYDSYRAKATAYETPYLQCSETSEVETDNEILVVFGMINNNSRAPKKEDYLAYLVKNDSPLILDKLINVSLDLPNTNVTIGRSGIDANISNSSVVCKTIVWGTKNVAIESYPPEGCLLVASDGFAGESVTIDIVNAFNIKVFAPNIASFYKLVPYNYDFEDTSKFDITKFIHAMRCILVEFRTHRKDTLAKTAERIEYVTVGGSVIKRQVLEYLKSCGIIYPSAHLYKVNETIMQNKGIYYNALSRMDTEQMQPAFLDFCRWVQGYNGG